MNVAFRWISCWRLHEKLRIQKIEIEAKEGKEEVPPLTDQYFSK